MIMCIQNLVKFSPFIVKIWSKNQILKSIKGHNSAANLPKMMLYNLNIDLVNDNVYTKLVSICQFVFKIWSKNQIQKSIKGHNSVANLPRMKFYNPNID